MPDSPKPLRPRPLSPHLQIYRLPLPALLSISHRMSGIALTLGIFVLVAWLWAGAFNAKCFENLRLAFTSPLGHVLLFGWMLAFFYHLCAGVRHLVWDTGAGFEKPVYRVTNWIVIVAALALTILTWLYAGGVR